MHSTAIAPRTELVFRHALVVRITHWVNALCLLVLLMSGLQIFNAHATLYWGSKSEPDRAILSMRAVQRDDGSYAGITTIGSHTFDTTGVLGLSGSGENVESRGFPAWITLPSYRDLATGRRWHFAFAWLFVAERARLPRLHDRQRPRAPRPRTDARGARAHRHVDLRAHPLPLPQG